MTRVSNFAIHYVVHGPAAVISPRCPLERNNLRSQPRPSESEPVFQQDAQAHSSVKNIDLQKPTRPSSTCSPTSCPTTFTYSALATLHASLLLKHGKHPATSGHLFSLSSLPGMLNPLHICLPQSSAHLSTSFPQHFLIPAHSHLLSEPFSDNPSPLKAPGFSKFLRLCFGHRIYH